MVFLILGWISVVFFLATLLKAKTLTHSLQERLEEDNEQMAALARHAPYSNKKAKTTAEQLL